MIGWVDLANWQFAVDEWIKLAGLKTFNPLISFHSSKQFANQPIISLLVYA